jgi:hypothetical protein
MTPTLMIYSQTCIQRSCWDKAYFKLVDTDCQFQSITFQAIKLLNNQCDNYKLLQKHQRITKQPPFSPLNDHLTAVIYETLTGTDNLYQPIWKTRPLEQVTINSWWPLRQVRLYIGFSENIVCYCIYITSNDVQRWKIRRYKYIFQTLISHR